MVSKLLFSAALLSLFVLPTRSDTLTDYFAQFGLSGKPDNLAAVLAHFGLLGRWSTDCTLDAQNPCRQVDSNRHVCGIRVIYETMPSGEPVQKTMFLGIGKIMSTMTITKATPITTEKLRLFLHVESVDPKWQGKISVPQPGENWIQVLEKQGDKFRTLDNYRDDGQKLYARSGQRYEPVIRPQLGPLVIDWRNTGEPVPLTEKCLAE